MELLNLDTTVRFQRKKSLRGCKIRAHIFEPLALLYYGSDLFGLYSKLSSYLLKLANANIYS